MTEPIIKDTAPPAPSDFIRDIVAQHVAEGKYPKIHTRFPPEPNGYLHIGHAKSICLNFGIAREFGGVCNLRMDDTNPTKEEIEYVESIQADVNWLIAGWADDKLGLKPKGKTPETIAEEGKRQDDQRQSDAGIEHLGCTVAQSIYPTEQHHPKIWIWWENAETERVGATLG